MLALLKENDIECLEGIHDTAVSSDPTFAAQYPHPYSATTAAAAAIKLSSSSSSSSKLIGLPFDKKLCLNKCFKCPECNKCFSQLGNLRTHQNIHSLVKPFQCKCNRQFSQCSHLNQHVRNKHDYKSPVGINDNTNNNINSNNNQYLLTKYQRIQENSTMRDSTLIPSSVSGCQPTLFTPFNHKTFTISSALTTHKNKHNLSFIGPTSDSPLLNSHSLTHDGYKEQLTLVPTSQVSQSNYDADQNNQITFPPEEWVPNYGQLSQNFLQNLQDSHIKTSDISHGRIFHLNWNNQDNISKILHES
ncbi:hypothetical protein Ahia01_000486500 [Argonauta hians]